MGAPLKAEPRPRGRSIGQTPPSGSKLDEYVSFWRRFYESQQPTWADEHQPMQRRELAAKRVLVKGKPLHDLPRELVRDFLVIPALRAQGMPNGLTGAWVETLINTALDSVLARSEEDASAIADKRYLGKRVTGEAVKPSGHPSPKAEIVHVVMGCWWAALTDPRRRVTGVVSPSSRKTPKAHNWDCEAAARRLGLSRDQVRRIVNLALADSAALGATWLTRMLGQAYDMADLLASYDRGDMSASVCGNPRTAARIAERA